MMFCIDWRSADCIAGRTVQGFEPLLHRYIQKGCNDRVGKKYSRMVIVMTGRSLENMHFEGLYLHLRCVRSQSKHA